MEETDKLRYPVGKYQRQDVITHSIINDWIGKIEEFPKEVIKEVKDLDEEELQYQYRPGSWTIKQVVHHCADSHMNSFIRFKLALTEENPTIKPYQEKDWAELPDVTDAPVEASIKILEGLHVRWKILLNSLQEEDYKKSFYHPESKRNIGLDDTLGLYAWHCQHHLHHIKQAKNYKNNF